MTSCDEMNEEKRENRGPLKYMYSETRKRVKSVFLNF